jgi:hypothetical protein
VVTADEGYLRESTLQPNAQIVQGYAANVIAGSTASVQGNTTEALVEYIKSLK